MTQEQVKRLRYLRDACRGFVRSIEKIEEKGTQEYLDSFLSSEEFTSAMRQLENNLAGMKNSVCQKGISK